MTHAGRIWRVAAAAATVGMIVAMAVMLREPASKAVREERGETTPAAAAVRVEHEFVTLDAEVPDAEPPKPSPTFSAPAPTFTKARWTFLGDGRHRPEPFPRVR